MHIRQATSEDSDGVIQLIDSVYGEYNDRVCLEGAESDLIDLTKSYLDVGGMFWVLDDQGKVRGSHAALPLPGRERVCQFKRLYLDVDLRGTRWGRELMQVTIDWTKEAGFARVEFWSDTRFERAHRFFEKFGFERDGRIREMFDGVDPYQEYFYFLDVSQ